MQCFHDKTTVNNSRKHRKQPQLWRRRQCLRCGATFTTYEQPSLGNMTVLQQDGKSQPFNIGRLIISINRSFQHNPEAGRLDSLALAETVQWRILRETRAPSADDIAALTHDTLLRYDAIAAMQYGAQHHLLMNSPSR